MTRWRTLRSAMERASAQDIERLAGDVPAPLITDTTELITPEIAYAMLERNKRNRPINWRRVEEYAKEMQHGRWVLHAQGIILDGNGNVLTGQKRLWAIIYSNTAVYMRISRGSPAEAAALLDRGDAQSARDLASRETGERHRPIEASVARGVLATKGQTRPSADEIASHIARHAPIVGAMLPELAGMRKTRGVVMLMAATCTLSLSVDDARHVAISIPVLHERLIAELHPKTPEIAWRGGELSRAMTLAVRIVAEHPRHIADTKETVNG